MLEITKHVTSEHKVTINKDDIAMALLEDTESDQAVLRSFKAMAFFLKAVPPEVIAQIDPTDRANMSSFFDSQAQRFAPLEGQL